MSSARKEIAEIINGLTGSRGRAGDVPQETLAAALGVSVATIARWAAGKGEPADAEITQKLIQLKNQRAVWYLRVAPFLLFVWSHPKGGEPSAHHSTFFSHISYTPISSTVVKCELELAVPFRFFSLIVISKHRDTTRLAETQSGPGDRVLRFEKRRAGFKAGERVEFFLVHSV